ncbi:MAG: gliding motility-associated ABC transporter permease subunit GldF [Opitutaceae bacterium]|nr:gliding motility-associated ABC transporter permease subunit GldF [Cytophagales bacterium]
MFSILKKEINSFLFSLIGFIVVLVFLVTNGLFIWVLPDTNLFDNGFATLDTFFNIAPFLFLFLVPAITMKSFAEERKSGTIELLFTKPINDIEIVLGKYFACVLLVLISLLPTLIYYVSVYNLGNPIGNIDSAGFFGSFLGLFLLGSVFVSIGIFCSSLTDNQIVAFILSLIISYLFYQGFDLLSGIAEKGSLTILISQFGIQYHYLSFSKGLVDSRDLIYFISIILFFVFATRLKLESRNWQ